MVVKDDIVDVNVFARVDVDAVVVGVVGGEPDVANCYVLREYGVVTWD